MSLSSVRSMGRKSRSELLCGGSNRRQWLYRRNRRWDFADYFGAARDSARINPVARPTSQKRTSGEFRVLPAEKHRCDPFSPAHAFRSREGDVSNN